MTLFWAGYGLGEGYYAARFGDPDCAGACRSAAPNFLRLQVRWQMAQPESGNQPVIGLCRCGQPADTDHGAGTPVVNTPGFDRSAAGNLAGKLDHDQNQEPLRRGEISQLGPVIHLLLQLAIRKPLSDLRHRALVVLIGFCPVKNGGFLYRLSGRKVAGAGFLFPVHL